MRDIYDENDYSFMNKSPSTPEPAGSDEIAPFEEPMNKPSIPEPTPVEEPVDSSISISGITLFVVFASLVALMTYKSSADKGECPNNKEFRLM